MSVRMVGGRRTGRRRTLIANSLAFTATLAIAALVVWSWELISRQTIWLFVQDAPEQAHINIREATFLGLVGAGGIGLQLNASINALRWADASVILMAIFLMVLVSAWVSTRVRLAITCRIRGPGRSAHVVSC